MLLTWDGCTFNQWGETVSTVAVNDVDELTQVQDDLRWLLEPSRPVSLCQNCSDRF